MSAPTIVQAGTFEAAPSLVVVVLLIFLLMGIAFYANSNTKIHQWLSRHQKWVEYRSRQATVMFVTTQIITMLARVNEVVVRFRVGVRVSMRLREPVPTIE